MPLVSVVMTVYGNAAYFPAAIESILGQTVSDLEVIVVTGSDDPEKIPDLVEQYAQQDSRIVHIQNNGKLELSAARNASLRKANGKYIAFMDGDDICAPQRLAIQISHMEAYPDIGAFGIRHSVMGPQNWTMDFFSCPDLVKAWMIFGVPLRHPTIMIRASLMSEHALFYDETINVAEDADIERRMSLSFAMSNINDPSLFFYRVHTNNTTSVLKENAFAITQMLIKRHLKATLDMDITDEDARFLHVHTSLLQHKEARQIEIFQRQDALLHEMVERNELHAFYKPDSLRAAIKHYLRKQFRKLSGEQYGSYLNIPPKLKRCYLTSEFWG